MGCQHQRQSQTGDREAGQGWFGVFHSPISPMSQPFGPRPSKAAMTKRKSKSAPTSAAASAIWGGRFDTGPDAIMQRINASIDIDCRLYAQDLAGSRAH